MHESMGVGTFLILEGALVLCVLVARLGCLRVVDRALVPGSVLHRIDLITRTSPLLAAVCVAAIVAGLILR